MEENRNYENATDDLITIVPEPERTDDVSSAEGFVFLLATAASFGFRHLMELLGAGKLPPLGGVTEVLGTLILYGVWLGALLLLTRWQKKEEPELLGFGDPYPFEVRKPGKMNAKTVFFAVVLLSVSSGVAFLARCILKTADVSEAAETFYPVTVVNSLLLAPVFEELIFRGFLQKNLRKYGDLTAIIIAALTFAIAHGSVVSGIGAFLHGLVFGYLAMYYGLGWSMAAHVLANLPAALCRLFPDVTFRFALGKKLYVLGIGGVFVEIEEAMIIVLLACYLVRFVKYRKKDPEPLWEDMQKMPVQFSSAIAIPLFLAVLMFFLRAFQVLL